MYSFALTHQTCRRKKDNSYHLAENKPTPNIAVTDWFNNFLRYKRYCNGLMISTDILKYYLSF